MNYRVDTTEQLRAVLRGLRKTNRMNQTEAGRLIGVSQRRLAAIEQNPGGTSFDQITRLVLALGAHVAFDYQGDDAGGFRETVKPGGAYAAKPAGRPPRSARSLAKDTW